MSHNPLIGAFFGGLIGGGYLWGMNYLNRKYNINSKITPPPENFKYNPEINKQFEKLMYFQNFNTFAFNEAVNNMDQLMQISKALNEPKATPHEKDKKLADNCYKCTLASISQLRLSTMNENDRAEIDVIKNAIDRLAQGYLADVVRKCQHYRFPYKSNA